MEWNEAAVSAAQQAMRSVNDATDEIAIKAEQIVSLMCVLMAAEGTPQYLECCYGLVANLATEIREANEVLSSAASARVTRATSS